MADPDARISDVFDLIVGTGIGGILAAMITAADGSTGRPLFSAREAVSFLRSRQRRLFRPAGCSVLRRRRGDGKFSAAGLEGVLREAFRGRSGRLLTLRDSCCPLLIPCYDLNSSAPFVFSRADAAQSASFDFEMWAVCRATSATPGLFRPTKIVSVDGLTACTAIDGGLAMSNPASAAVTHVLHNKREFPAVHGVEDLLLLSLGSSPPLRRHVWPATKWSGEAIVDIAMEGISETVDQILSNAFSWNRQDYVRIQGNGWETELEREGGAEGLKRAGDRMMKERNVQSLPFGGKRFLTETNGESMDAFVRRLIGILPSRPSKTDVAVTVLKDSR
ncbi:hypothetical protein HPP92_013469 [Vanilla planifolia]|uniref:Patatin n=1 Tax=Vanilla planifolia TaxID=51239 RepID=A0A835V011_VANPL|nr:hypothetical protein HPP92_013469 [Vanilla planifolia]